MSTESHPTKAGEIPGAVERHIETVAMLERQWLDERRIGEHLGDAVATRIGQMPVVLFHAVWFLAWIVVNVGWIPSIEPFDPFPFGFLTLVVSLEAIFLSLFLLISQNRLTRQSDKRTHLDLQVNLLIETEVTKMMRVMVRMCHKLDIDLSDDPEFAELAATTDLQKIVRTVELNIPDVGSALKHEKPKPSDPDTP